MPPRQGPLPGPSWGSPNPWLSGSVPRCVTGPRLACVLLASLPLEPEWWQSWAQRSACRCPAELWASAAPPSHLQPRERQRTAPSVNLEDLAEPTERFTAPVLPEWLCMITSCPWQCYTATTASTTDRVCGQSCATSSSNPGWGQGRPLCRSLPHGSASFSPAAGPDRALQTVRQTMIDFLQNHSQEARPPACPPLGPVE